MILMSKTLVCVAHPNLERSRINKTWIAALEKHPECCSVHIIPNMDELTAEKIAEERKLIEQFDNVILQFPLYNFSCPVHGSFWIEKVFGWGWAFGLPDKPEQNHMRNIRFGAAVSAGCKGNEFTSEGYLGHTLEECLTHFKAFVNYGHSSWIGFHCLYGAEFGLAEEILTANCEKYLDFLRSLK